MKKLFLLFFLFNCSVHTHAQCWKAVSAGVFHTIAIKSDGTLWGWGTGDAVGYFAYTNIPFQIGADTNWVTVAAGEQFSLGIKRDGSLWAWGYNRAGNLGLWSSLGQYEASLLKRVGTDADWTSVSAGYDHSLAIKTNGTLWSWGSSAYGQLGGGTALLASGIPQQVGSDNDWKLAVAGSGNSFAIKNNGTLWAWGANFCGQLGDGTTTHKYSPQKVGSDTDWRTVDGGTTHTLAIKVNGTLWAWGSNLNGQLGDGSSNNSFVPVQIGTDTWLSAKVSHSQDIENYGILGSTVGHSVAVKTDGTMWSWGSNQYNQLGDGTNINKNTPTQISSLSNWRQVSIGFWHSLSINAAGNLYDWGFNRDGQLGDSTNINKSVPVKIICDRSAPVTQCWQFLSAGSDHSFAIKNDGSLWAWGVNTFYPFGSSDNTSSKIPKQIGFDFNWASVSTGQAHSLGLKTDGTLWGWGENSSGQVGDGTNYTKYFPTQVGTGNDWQSVSAGKALLTTVPYEEHSAGIKTDHTLWMWGDNQYWQLGDGTNINKAVPVQIGNAEWQSVSAGEGFTLAIKTDGTLWGWGNNSHGQLGTGDTIERNSPNQIGTAANWKIITAGWGRSFGIKADGTLWGWGEQAFYNPMFGGYYSDTSYAIQIDTALTWTSVAVGKDHILAIKADRTLWAWGGNEDGQYGNGSIGRAGVPVQIDSATDWKFISAGLLNSFALKTDNTLWNWGWNYEGELGNGIEYWPQQMVPHLVKCELTKHSFPVPVKITSFTAQKQNRLSLLTWRTGSELNSREYQIERSVDGAKFNLIGTVASQNSGSGSSYSFKDLHPEPGKNYYRLKNLDFDGRFSYSNIILLTFNWEENGITVYPNPVKDLLHVETNFESQKADMSVTDLSGRIVLKPAQYNSKLAEIPIDKLKAGIYLLTVSDKVNTISKKIIKN